MTADQANATPGRSAWTFLFLAWSISLGASLGVLFVGEVMGQAPCNLCWFQRAFMFPLVVVLGVASWRSDSAAWRYALPLALGGLLTAGYHSALYLGFVPAHLAPCTQGVPCTSADMTILGGVPLPVLAVVAFAAIAVLSLMVRRSEST